jgi:YaiO family outer membrane protein
MKRTAVLIFLFLLALAPCAPGTARAQDTDALFEQARQLAFDNRRDEAARMCREILETCSQCHDARVLLGRVLAWDGQYEAARIQLEQVLAAAPEYHDARSALIDTALWSGNPGRALELAEQGLALAPDYEDYRKARERVRASLDPHSGEPEESLTLGYTADAFTNTPLSGWHLGALEWERRYGGGSLLVRVNRARRFDKNATQFEIEGYPALSRRTYLFLGAGVSGHALFPTSYINGELFHGTPGGWEFSAGTKMLNFSPDNTRIHTASVGKYLDNYRAALRAFYNPDSAGDALSGVFTIRRETGHREYVQLLIGAGSAAAETLTAQDAARLDSSRLELQWQRRIARNTYLRLLFGYEEEDTAPGVSRTRFSYGMALKHLY